MATINRLRIPAPTWAGARGAFAVPRARLVGRRLTTAPGPDPVLPAARCGALTAPTGHPVVDSTESAPTQSMVAQPTISIVSNTCAAPQHPSVHDFRSHPGLATTPRENDRAMSCDLGARRAHQARPLAQLAPPSRLKLALFFCSVSFTKVRRANSE